MKYIVPQVATFNSDSELLKQILKKYNLKWKKIIDLWCWRWKMLRFFEKNFKMKTTWYEIDLLNIITAKIFNIIFKSKSHVIKWDYIKADIKKYDFIYLYLFPEIIENIENKIYSEAKKWTTIIVNAFKFKNHKPTKIYFKEWKEKFFIYKI